jgi:hypothetical protein
MQARLPVSPDIGEIMVPCVYYTERSNNGADVGGGEAVVLIPRHVESSSGTCRSAPNSRADASKTHHHR